MQRMLTGALLMLAACSPGPAPTTAPQATHSTRAIEAALSGPLEYGMCGMYMLDPGTPASSINERAGELFEQARTQANDGRHAEAAQGFRSAAQVLLEGAELPEPSELERNRRIAYANMLLSWLNIDAVDMAREQLEQLATTDPALAPDLRAASSRLPQPPSCELAALADLHTN